MAFTFNVADQVLNSFRERFIAEMDANTVVMDYLNKGIIPRHAQVTISQNNSPKQQNALLHDCLKRTCTDTALETACHIISAVEGNPRMSGLGKDMLECLQSGVCVHHFILWLHSGALKHRSSNTMIGTRKKGN